MLQKIVFYTQTQQLALAPQEGKINCVGCLAPWIVTVWVPVPIGRWRFIRSKKRRARTGGTTPQLELLDQFLWIFFGI